MPPTVHENRTADGKPRSRRRRSAGRRAAPTSHDVARLAGVSRTVVSFVLNNRPYTGIPEETRQRVLRAVAELGYRPNSAAQSLASGRTRTLAVVMRSVQTDVYGDGFAPELLRGVATRAQLAGFRIMLEYPVTSRTENPYLAPIQEGRVDGLLVFGPPADDPALAEVVATGKPVVVVGDPGAIGCPSVDVDNVGAARLAVSHLVGHGYRRIGMITNLPVVHPSSRDRLLGYQQALREAEIPLREEWIVEGGRVEASGRQAMEELLDRTPRPEAVFVASDQVAFGALAALQMAGLRVPDDLALFGFDDLPLAAVVPPPLSTVQVPMGQLGDLACRRLLDLIGGKPPADQRQILPTQLVVRQSCGDHG